MATTHAPAGGGTRIRVQRFGTFLSNMILPNIGAFIAWGLITALFIQTGWIALIGDRVFGADPTTNGYGFVSVLGAWADADGNPMHDSLGIVGPMITYLLPLLIGYTGGRMMYNDNLRGGVVGAIATMGAVTGASVPMFLGAMIMGPLGGWSMKKIDALWDGKIKPGLEMLVNNFSAGIWGGILAVLGFVVAGPIVEGFSNLAANLVEFLVDNSLLPLTSIFIEPAKVLFLNNAIGNGILVPLGTTEASGPSGKSILFMLEANPGPGLGLLIAFALFGKGISKSSAPGAILIEFIGGIHEIYFPYVLMKPRLILAVILGGMTGVATNLVFDSGLRSPASPGSIIAVWIGSPPSSLIGVTLSVILAAAVSCTVASVMLRLDKTPDDGDLSAATADMEARKGKKSSIAGALGGSGTSARSGGPIRNIVFACDAGMGSSAMGASVLRKKMVAAGHTDVSVVNKAISNLTDTVDLVITHQDLTDRARTKAPSAHHVSVDNFMGSPRYDEVVELVGQANSGEATSADDSSDTTAEGQGGALDAGLLSREAIVLDAAGSRDDAITRAGELLVATGAVEASYVAAMHERETSVSTYMGNLLAIPHGTNEAKSAINRSAISFVRYPAGVDWKGKEVRFVIGIAGAGKDHLKLLGKIAEVFLDEAQVARLDAATSADDVLSVLSNVQPA